MATLQELITRGVLGEQIPKLPPGRLADRRFLYTSRFREWVVDELSAVQATLFGGNVSGREQLRDLIVRFVGGRSLARPRQFSLLIPANFSIWELKTGDIRVFGWFPSKDCFIASTAGDAYLVKEEPLGYICKIMWTVAERDKLDLDEPKAIFSRETDDVIGPGN